MKTLKIFFGFLLLSAPLLAQKIDEEKMKRDLAVAENILGVVLNENNGVGLFRENIKSSYVEDYGVILSLPSHAYNTRAISVGANSYSFSTDEGSSAVVISSDGEDAVAINVPKVEVKRVSIDSLENLRKQKSIEAAKTFLADYGNLISQLKPEQHILITNRNNEYHWMHLNKDQNEISIEAKVADINAFKTGRMSREEFFKAVKVIDRKVTEEKTKDLELLTTIMSRLYRSDLSNTYYSSGGINYYRLSDFGVVYRMKVYSSTEGDNGHTIITRNITNLTQAERDAIVKDMYPEFLTTLKENILDYGKTLNSLKADELLMFKVELTKCTGCNLPKVIEVSIKNSVLQDYSTSKISKAEALKKFNVKEGDLQ